MKYKRTLVLFITLSIALTLTACKTDKMAEGTVVSSDVSDVASSGEESELVSSETSSAEVSSQAEETASASSEKVSSKGGSSKVTGDKETGSKADSVNVELVSCPITKVPDMIMGSKTPYSAKLMSGYVTGICIISSFAELTILKDMQKNMPGSDCFPDTNYNNYNQTFFQENTIIAMCIPYKSSSYRTQMDSLTKASGGICINITTFHPPANEDGMIPITDDVCARYLLIEVKNADILGVTQYSYYETLKTYPQY